ncbi:hypothetical protein [Streptomyces sp. NPDC006997]|uniref:hypothetical protein n=1 Tax=Streptomyces sp. NPDC006997 TaxID=3155356 RepID=UPI0033DA9784
MGGHRPGRAAGGADAGLVARAPVRAARPAVRIGGDGAGAAARETFERVLAVRDDVGLLAERWDADAGRQLGNAPQACSHTALVETAFTLR